MNQKKKRPAKIELDGERGELVIVWKGGGESRHALVELRQNCPCAMCRDQRAQGDVQEGELTLLEGEAATATAAPVCVVPVARTSSFSSCRCGRRPVKYKRSRTVPVGSRTTASGHPGCSHCTRGSAPRIGRNHMEAAGPVAGPRRCS